MSTLNIALEQWMAAGDEPTPWVLLVGCVFALWGGWFCAAIVGWAAWRRPEERAYILGLMVAAGVASLLSHGLASYLHLPRPFMLDLAPAYIVHSGRGSLPSTHATVMFTIALAFLLRAGLRNMGVPLLLLATLTGWARIYVGVHFPRDILAGLLLAVLVVGVFVALQGFGPRCLADFAGGGLHRPSQQ
ncbi:phosphatase PAP2 family protein [Variovorax sp. PBL-E5]|uniref:phosphatase PAP2 family protein n=1 Tax=Variovorax sp. PBL-E5 TaxID=434014 RepID=UPI001317CB17|nr:phosphatase PAP2 family protein [Variovorax sp. PBL-E5]VTU22052.1 Putative undecaprenyl-diphosphatase YbjG [Variovorax sp. PBL-E5]